MKSPLPPRGYLKYGLVLATLVAWGSVIGLSGSPGPIFLEMTQTSNRWMLLWWLVVGSHLKAHSHVPSASIHGKREHGKRRPNLLEISAEAVRFSIARTIHGRLVALEIRMNSCVW